MFPSERDYLSVDNDVRLLCSLVSHSLLRPLEALLGEESTLQKSKKIDISSSLESCLAMFSTYHCTLHNPIFYLFIYSYILFYLELLEGGHCTGHFS